MCLFSIFERVSDISVSFKRWQKRERSQAASDRRAVIKNSSDDIPEMSCKADRIVITTNATSRTYLTGRNSNRNQIVPIAILTGENIHHVENKGVIDNNIVQRPMQISRAMRINSSLPDKNTGMVDGALPLE